VDAGADCCCVGIPPGGLSEASFVVAIVVVFTLPSLLLLQYSNLLIFATFVK
jgi:hypothetical protein